MPLRLTDVGGALFPKVMRRDSFLLERNVHRVYSLVIPFPSYVVPVRNLPCKAMCLIEGRQGFAPHDCVTFISSPGPNLLLFESFRTICPLTYNWEYNEPHRMGARDGMISRRRPFGIRIRMGKQKMLSAIGWTDPHNGGGLVSRRIEVLQQVDLETRSPLEVFHPLRFLTFRLCSFFLPFSYSVFFLPSLLFFVFRFLLFQFYF